MRKKSLLAVILAILVGATVLGSATAQDDGTLPASDLSSPVAPFVYTYDFAVSKGATAEWRKMEGVTLDTVNNNLYLAVSNVERGMSDTEGDIQLAENKCGAVFVGALDAEFNTAALTPAVNGGPYDDFNSDYPCNADAIANPDNLFADAQGNLWIGEDTSYHANNFLWLWNGTELKRFAAVPRGAEVTGLRVEPDGTIFMNIQHPDAINPYPYNRGTVGVITGFKAGDDFESLPVPEDDAANVLTLAAGQYQVLARSGEAIPGDYTSGVVGAVVNADGSTHVVCDNPDGNMFLPTTPDGTEGYLYSNWECNPGAVSQLYIKQSADGNWTSVEGQMVDFHSVNGTWNNCNASVTPWNTALTSEEYPPDVQGEWEDGWLPAKDAFTTYLGHPANPLDYGYAIELSPSGGEDGGIGINVTKHYVLGRSSKEQALVMPDGKTAYMGDDGTNRILYKFVADSEGDLSAGTLYAAKITQDGDTLNLEWIELGNGNDADVAAYIRGMDGM